MTLYQKFPKQSIASQLKQYFTDVELDAIRLDLVELMNTSRTVDELRIKVSRVLRERQALDEFKRIHYDNFIGI